MFVVRPAETSDIPALEALAAVATPGVHTLPRSRKAIEGTIERSTASFAASPGMPADESYFFVLEADGEIAGTAAISATAGCSGAFFAFRNDVIHQVSRDLGISHDVHALTLCSDLTHHSQLGSFFLRHRLRVGAEASLLSRSRLLFAAAAPHRFADKFFALMAGVTDANGRSPFWEALGRKFFQMDFLAAERMIEGTRNCTLIVELMPHYPVYVPLLPDDAQAAMGRVHEDAELPFRILSEEGFEPDEYVDIFDSGPVLRAHKKTLRSFSASTRRLVTGCTSNDAPNRDTYLIATAREERFRALIADCPSTELSESLALSDEAKRRLDVADGDAVLCVKL